jgi:hypothetical protein
VDAHETAVRERWDTISLAYLGALLGMALAMVHNIHHGVGGQIPNEDPFLHSLFDLITFASAGPS